MSQLDALRATVAAMELGPEHGALVAFCEGLAEVIDLHPERATLWREYRPAVELLMAAGETDADNGEAALLKLVSTAVGDASKPGARKSRGGGSGGSGDARPAVDAVATSGSGRRSRASA